jgi:hypothetical protein
MMSTNGVSKRIKIMQLLAKMPREERRAFVRAIGRVSESAKSLNQAEEKVLIKSLLAESQEKQQEILKAVETTLDEEPAGEVATAAISS